MNKVKVSDIDTSGKSGIYDSQTFCDSILEDVNTLQRLLVSGEYLNYCKTVTVLVEKIKLLKDGIRRDRQDQEDQIAQLLESGNGGRVDERVNAGQ